MSKTIEINRVKDIQPGDRVTLTRNDTTVSGTVSDVTHGDYTHLDIATLPCVLIVGDGYWMFVAATREVPDAPPLPTEPGSVITNATIRGVEGQTAILCDSGDWLTPRPVASIHYYHTPQRITAWEPARIVPESEEEDW